MKINSLSLNTFRNYDHFFIEFDHDINILIGSNGQGKTNLIEAIYLPSTSGANCAFSYETLKSKYEIIRKYTKK